MSVQDRVTIKIPKVLYHRLQEVIADTGFSSVTEFVVYVMRDIISLKGSEPRGTLTRDEIEEIRQRLKSLGYMG
jgi:hypothetical protein